MLLDVFLIQDSPICVSDKLTCMRWLSGRGWHPILCMLTHSAITSLWKALGQSPALEIPSCQPMGASLRSPAMLKGPLGDTAICGWEYQPQQEHGSLSQLMFPLLEELEGVQVVNPTRCCPLMIAGSQPVPKLMVPLTPPSLFRRNSKEFTIA